MDTKISPCPAYEGDGCEPSPSYYPFIKKNIGCAESCTHTADQKDKKGKTIKVKRVTLMALSWQAGTRRRCS